MEDNRQIFTVGHSNHNIEYFLTLLKSQNINCLIDVRSTPASSYNPQFNKNSLKNYLAKYNIVYMHFGNEFGARHDDHSLLDDEGIVHFKTFQKTSQFQKGIERVKLGLKKGFRISLMCSEGNPLECHRFSMISSYFENINIKVFHILKDRRLISHLDLEKKMIKKYEKKLPKPSLFEPSIDTKEQVEIAYQLHNKEIGWQAKKYTI